MRFCVHCGNQLTEGAAFCTSCGAPVAAAAKDAGQAPAASHTSTPQPPAAAEGSTPVHPAQPSYSSAPPQGQPSSPLGGHSSAAPQPAWAQTSGAPRAAIDWKSLMPGLLRLLAAVTLAMTALGNWWVIDGSSSEGMGDSLGPTQYATHHSVLPLIGCIGVVLAAVAQIALLPQFLGAAMQPIVRFAVRSVLCLPALIAIVMALVTTLGGPDSDKFSAIGVTMLAMAVGFALTGLDDARDALPVDVLRWATVAIAALGVLLSIVSIIQFMGSDSTEGKLKWLTAICSILFVALAGALVAWIGVTRPAFGDGLLIALAGSLAFALLTRGWISDDTNLYFISVLRHGHGAALIALALALATAHEVASHGRDSATDDASVARRLTQWVVPGFAVAAVAALFNALAFIGMRTDYTPGGQTWFLVLMFLTALVYAACAFLLKTNPMGRLIAVLSAVTLSLTILITLAASKSSGPVCEAFTEGAYLWLPLAAAAALTIPPAVRRVAGPIAPQARHADPQAAPAGGQHWNDAPGHENGQV